MSERCVGDIYHNLDGRKRKQYYNMLTAIDENTLT